MFNKYFKKIVLKLIELIEKYEYRNLNIDENNIDKKILDTIDLSNIQVETEYGKYVTANKIHKTQPYTIYRITTDAFNLKLECADNHIIFDHKHNEIFVKNLIEGTLIKTKYGIDRVKTIEKYNSKVSMYDLSIDSYDHTYYTNDILSHNTIISSIFIAWYLIFHYQKNVLILSNKGATTREIVDKTKVIFENLPFFLKPGIIKNDVFNLKFDNECRIIAQTTTKKAGIGFTIHLLFLDEFAHIHPSILSHFYENVYPTVSATPNTKIIITSTPNGFNQFHTIYDNAEKGLNEFKAFRIDWWQVEGRDEAWMKREIRNLGSEDAFNRQYGNQFISGTNLLLAPMDIKRLKEAEEVFESVRFINLDDLEIEYTRPLKFKKSFNVDNIKDINKYYVFSVDIAEGILGDFSVINIFEIDIMDEKDFKNIVKPNSFQDFFALKQVGRFHSNEHGIEDFSKILYILIFEIFNSENCKLVIEWNTYGSELVGNLQKVFPKRNNFDEEIIVKFKHRNDAKITKFGLKIKHDNKKLLAQKLRKNITLKRLNITDTTTVDESFKFGKTPSGRYAAMTGHDDLIMTCLNVSEFFNTLDFSDICEEKYEMLDLRTQNLIEDCLEKKEKHDDGSTLLIKVKL